MFANPASTMLFLTEFWPFDKPAGPELGEGSVMSESDWQKIAELARDNKVVAIGECGLERPMKNEKCIMKNKNSGRLGVGEKAGDLLVGHTKVGRALVNKLSAAAQDHADRFLEFFGFNNELDHFWESLPLKCPAPGNGRSHRRQRRREQKRRKLSRRFVSPPLRPCQKWGLSSRRAQKLVRPCRG